MSQSDCLSVFVFLLLQNVPKDFTYETDGFMLKRSEFGELGFSYDLIPRMILSICPMFHIDWTSFT